MRSKNFPGFILTPLCSKLSPFPLATSSFIPENGTKMAFSVRRSKRRGMHFRRRTILAARYGHYFSVSRVPGAPPPPPQRIIYPPSLLLDRSSSAPSFLQPCRYSLHCTDIEPRLNSKIFCTIYDKVFVFLNFL